jgi:hypothetical protein
MGGYGRSPRFGVIVNADARSYEEASALVRRANEAGLYLVGVPDRPYSRRPDGRLGEAKRTIRDRLHGRDQAVPIPDRVSGAHANDRAGVAGGRRRSNGVGKLEMKVGLVGIHYPRPEA